MNENMKNEATNRMMLILLTNDFRSSILFSLKSLDISAGKTISIIESGNKITEQIFMLEKKNNPHQLGLNTKL